MEEWNKVGDSFNFRGIEATAYKSKNARILEHFELGIFFGTFEERGLVSSTLLNEKSCLYTITILFNEARNGELRKKYDSILTEQVKKCSEKQAISVEDISIKNVEENIEQILSKIPSECWGPKANWFLDLGGTPIPYFLGLLGYLRDIFPPLKLMLFNPTGDYGSDRSGYTFTTGFDKNIWIPRLWGYPDPTLGWTYVFLLGFEGARSSDVYYICEPQNVKAILSSPGYYPDYEKVALSRNERFLRETGLWIKRKQPDVIKTDAADPVQTWAVLQEIVNEYTNKSNICFVPLGTKGHALGSGLCALANGSPAVLYHMPRAYSIRDVKRGEYLWKYEVSV